MPLQSPSGRQKLSDGAVRTASVNRTMAQHQSYLKAFLEDPKSYDFGEFSQRICQVYNTQLLSSRERELAEEILRDLSDSVELQVREALSAHLKESDILPNDIAVQLACDVESVSLPMLEFSVVLSDKDLIEIIQTKGSSEQNAIARRKKVSEEVSEAVVEAGNEQPIKTLVTNKGAEISEDSLTNVVQLFPGNTPIHKAMIARPELPIKVADKLAEAVTESLQFELVSRHATSANLVEALMHQGSEGATMMRLEQYDEINDAESLADHLHRMNRLTPSLLMRSLYMGQLDFFEFSLARLTQEDIDAVRDLMSVPQSSAFKKLYRAAGLPARFFSGFTTGLSELSPEINALAAKKTNAVKRRVVSRLVKRRDFNRGEFESAMVMNQAR
ncbi:MAG: DUF2336 domain-containing protein [Pseudomonadota bacterium]